MLRELSYGPRQRESRGVLEINWSWCKRTEKWCELVKLDNVFIIIWFQFPWSILNCFLEILGSFWFKKVVKTCQLYVVFFWVENDYF